METQVQEAPAGSLPRVGARGWTGAAEAAGAGWLGPAHSGLNWVHSFSPRRGVWVHPRVLAWTCTTCFKPANL